MEARDFESLNIDTDEILNLEDQYYQEGFQEGQEHSTRQQYMEGKEFGYQTGFQRFLIIGYIEGLLNYWKRNIDAYGGHQNNTLNNHITQLETLISEIQTTNGDKEVEAYEKIMVKSRNKLRVIATITRESWKINNVDQLIKEMGGKLKVSENVDEMW